MKEKIEVANAKARKLGLSYGLYVGLRDTGALESYIKHQEYIEKQRENANVYHSAIIGCNGGNGIANPKKYCK